MSQVAPLSGWWDAARPFFQQLRVHRFHFTSVCFHETHFIQSSNLKQGSLLYKLKVRGASHSHSCFTTAKLLPRSIIEADIEMKWGDSAGKTDSSALLCTQLGTDRFLTEGPKVCIQNSLPIEFSSAQTYVCLRISLQNCLAKTCALWGFKGIAQVIFVGHNFYEPDLHVGAPHRIFGKSMSVKSPLVLFSKNACTPPKPGLSILCFLLLQLSNIEKKKGKEKINTSIEI